MPYGSPVHLVPLRATLAFHILSVESASRPPGRGVLTLEGFALALVILFGVVALAFSATRRWWRRYSYEITPSGIRLMLLRRICFFAIPAHKITGVRIQDTPAGYFAERHPLKVIHLEDFALAAEGICVECKGGAEILLTPEDSRDFLRRVAASGMPGEIDSTGQRWSRHEVETASAASR
jgi:hypothetical protein